MQEVEVKILEIDPKKVQDKLYALGAEKIFDGEVSGFIYDFPDGKLNKKKQVLRLRKEGDRAMLAFKHKLSVENVKVSDEFEVEVDNFEITQKIIDSLGLIERKKISKHRVSFLLNNVRFEIDKFLGELEYVPAFLEIEAEDAEIIYQYAEMLGFSRADCKPWSGFDMMKCYGTE
ncbi:class IV adenylate cyclase [archaeon]|jgi:adenylate cyclase, class 2|nr:class IV adenylate cyclase [archaeon]MBT3450366.1 class IV adenylate cyclase [archaeon]MBT6868859.1 class IV adenylate cyclase [archaeon]MBT7192920.1 class IV adenylate cyclase [archaeon]MBT7380886.1 class IV adenylate cyclase [archaeon]